MEVTRREAVQLLGLGAAAATVAVACRPPGREETAPPELADDLVSSSAVALAAAIRNRTISSRELVRACTARIRETNPTLNAVVRLRAAAALAEAGQADAALAAGREIGPLHGVPMTIKDSLDTAGMVSTGGTKGRAGFVPARDATVVARLRAAGAILLGKTNTPELTLSFETDNLVYGRTNNPFDPERTAGGSSGGAAAIIAVGGSPFDIGSDTGGSIRVPAHFCGIAGLKPTSGRVPRTGHIISHGGIHDSLTQLGPMARRVADLALILPIIAGPDFRDPFVAPVPLGDPGDVRLADLRVAWHAENGIAVPTPETRRTVREASAALARAGCAVTEHLPDAIPRLAGRIGEVFVWIPDGGAWVSRLLAAAGTTEWHPLLQSSLDQEAIISSADLTAALEARDRFRSEMLASLESFDVFLSPVTASPALPHGTSEAEDVFPGFSYTQVHNLTGWPAAVVRCGTSPEGLPIGVQVAAAPWREDVALAVAERLETAFGGWSPPGAPAPGSP